MGAVLIAIGGRMGTVLPGVPCLWAAAASGTSVRSPMVSSPRIPTILPIGYSEKDGAEQPATSEGDADCKDDVTFFCRESMVEK